MSRAQNRVNSLMPESSNSASETSPKEAQKSDCDVSKRLAKRRQTRQELPLFSVSGNPPGKL